LIFLDAAESHSSVVVGDEPRNGSLDHRSKRAVVLFEVALAPSATGLDEFIVVGG
jgi:hypothetical protein